MGDVSSLDLVNLNGVPLQRPHVSDFRGITHHSLKTFYDNRERFGTLHAAFVYFDHTDAVFDNFFISSNHYGGRFHKLEIPYLVLRDDEMNEMWLGGCNCGYGGEGPHGTETILLECGLTKGQVEPIFSYRIVKFFKKQSGDFKSEYRDSPLRSLNEIPPHQSRHAMHCHIFYDGYLTFAENCNRWKSDSLQTLKYYKSYIQNPSEIIVMSKDEAMNHGYVLDENIVYPVVVRDTSEQRQLLLHPFLDDAKPFLKQQMILETIKMCDFKVPERNFLEKISDWLNTGKTMRLQKNGDIL